MATGSPPRPVPYSATVLSRRASPLAPVSSDSVACPPAPRPAPDPDPPFLIPAPAAAVLPPDPLATTSNPAGAPAARGGAPPSARLRLTLSAAADAWYPPAPPRPHLSLRRAQSARDAGGGRLEAARLRVALLLSSRTPGGPTAPGVARAARLVARREAALAALQSAVVSASSAASMAAGLAHAPTVPPPVPPPPPATRLNRRVSFQQPLPRPAPPPHSRRAFPHSGSELLSLAAARAQTIRLHRGLSAGGVPCPTPPTALRRRAPSAAFEAARRGARPSGPAPASWRDGPGSRRHSAATAACRAEAFTFLCALACPPAKSKSARKKDRRWAAVRARRAESAAAAAAAATARRARRRAARENHPPASPAPAGGGPTPLRAAVAAAALPAPALVSTLAVLSPHCCLGSRLARSLHPSSRGALSVACRALAAALAARPDTVLVALLRTPADRLVLARTDDCALPRVPVSRGPSRDCSVTDGATLASFLCPGLAARIHFLAADLPPGEGRPRQCRVVVSTDAADVPPPTQAGWAWVPAKHLRGYPDDYLAACAAAATMALGPAPELAPAAAPPVSPTLVPTPKPSSSPPLVSAPKPSASPTLVPVPSPSSPPTPVPVPSPSSSPTLVPAPTPPTSPTPEPAPPASLPNIPAPSRDPDALRAMGAVAAATRARFQKGSAYLRSWADSSGRMDAAAFAASPPALRCRGAHVSRPHLRHQLLTPRHRPPATKPYAYPTNGSPPPGFRPASFRDLWKKEAWARASSWWRSALPFLADCARLGSDAKRGRVPVAVFTQLDLVEAARGVVWDCRGERPVPADWAVPIESHLDLDFLGAALDGYPDQELRDFMTKGAATSSDAAGLTMVLGPHLTSLAVEGGFDQVNANVMDFAERGWFEIFRGAFPFCPCRSTPKGTAEKAGGTLRPTSDGGCPRAETSPPATSLNDATRSARLVPEVKPTVAEFANDIAVLRYAADLFGEELILISDDFKCYFNQFRTHPSEWFKAAFLWIEDALGLAAPIWVVEYVLGFGLTAASGIAQRFSHALLWVLAMRFDAEEAALPELDPVRAQYLRERAALGEFQAALFSLLCYTDDTAMAVVGIDRAARLLEAWGKLVADVRLMMAGPSKRQVGSCIRWNGVLHNAYLCNQVIPAEKVLRSRRTLRAIAQRAPMPFREYRSAVGLLGHIHCVLRAKKLDLYGLFLPFRAGYRNPEGNVRWSDAVVERAEAWDQALLGLPGASCADPPAHAPFSASPSEPGDVGRCFFAYCDAALLGAPVPGIGVYCAGFFLSYALPPGLLGYPIPLLEFLGIVAAAICLPAVLLGAPAVLITDSITCALAINHDSAHTEEMQWLHMAFLAANGPTETLAEVRHGYGETNPGADLPSRGRLAELAELGRQLGVRLTRLPTPPAFDAVVGRFLRRFGERPAPEGGLRQRRRVLHKNALALAQRCAAADKDGHKGRLPLPLPRLRAPDTKVSAPLPAPRGRAARAHPLSGCRPVAHPRPSCLPRRLARVLGRRRASPLARAALACSRRTTTFPAPHLPRRAGEVGHLYRLAGALRPAPLPRRANRIAAPPRSAPPGSPPALPAFGRPTRAPTRCPAATPSTAAWRRTSLPQKQETAAGVLPSAPPRCRLRPPAAVSRARRCRQAGPAACAPPSPYSYSFDGTAAQGIFDSLGYVLERGVPEGTQVKDDLAWRRWSEFCAIGKTNPWRLDRAAHSGADSAGMDRESDLLCGFLIWCYDLISPRAKADSAPRPQSAYNMVAAVRRVHKRRNVTMVSNSQLSATLKGITAMHIAEHGAESLLPNRKEPIDAALVRMFLSTPNGAKLGSATLDWAAPTFLCTGALYALASGTGFRKAEAALPNGAVLDDRRLRRSSLLWRIDGRIYADPTEAQLLGLVSGRDMAVLKPPRCKNDPDGTVFGTHPIYQPYVEGDITNAAAWLRRIELLFPCQGPRRAEIPLFFTSAAFAPMTHSTVDSMLGHFLRLYMSAERARDFSFHSFRIGFACCLLAAGCPYDMIQALARWRSAKSAKIYARLNPEAHTAWVTKSLQHQASSTTGRRLPVIDADEMVATFAAAETFFSRASA